MNLDQKQLYMLVSSQFLSILPSTSRDQRSTIGPLTGSQASPPSHLPQPSTVMLNKIGLILR